MNDAERDRLGDLLNTDPSVSDELRRRFEGQARELVRRPIGAVGRITRVVGIVVMGIGALFVLWNVAFGVFLFRVHPADFGVLLWGVAFSAGFLLLAMGVFHCAYELLGGSTAPRRVQKVSAIVRYGSAFLIGVLVPVLVMSWLPDEKHLPQFMFIAGILTLFYWVVAVVLAVRRLLTWYREDIVLEQRRTQLAIELLREALQEKAKG